MKSSNQKLVASMYIFLCLSAHPIIAMRIMEAQNLMSIGAELHSAARFKDIVADNSCSRQMQKFEHTANMVKAAYEKGKAAGGSTISAATKGMLRVHSLVKTLSISVKKGCKWQAEDIDSDALQALKDVAVDGIRKSPCFHKVEKNMNSFEALSVLLSKDCKPAGSNDVYVANNSHEGPTQDLHGLKHVEEAAEKEADDAALELSDLGNNPSALLQVNRSVVVSTNFWIIMAIMAIGAWIAFSAVFCIVLPFLWHLLKIVFCLLKNGMKLIINIVSFGLAGHKFDLGKCLRWAIKDVGFGKAYRAFVPRCTLGTSLAPVHVFFAVTSDD